MKTIINHTNYSVTEDGKIWSEKSNKFLKAGINNPGYNFIVICENGVKHNLAVHRLVGEYYVPKVDGKDWINHKDGNKLNNHYTNLEWSTRTENVNHALEIGLIPTGENHHNSKKVKHLITGKVYPTLKDAALDNGYKRFTLGKMLLGTNSNRSNMIYI